MGFTLTPEARLGYRYDFITTPVKLKAAFLSTGGTNTAGNTFTFVGPDPDTGNFLAGASLGASTDSWQFGVNYDWIRGNNGSTAQIGMLDGSGPDLGVQHGQQFRHIGGRRGERGGEAHHHFVIHGPVPNHGTPRPPRAASQPPSA